MIYQKQGETISISKQEELESNEEGNDFYKTYSDFSKMLKDAFYRKYQEHYNFYGAIRVKGKGLIYVAKLNKEGELALL